MGHCLDSSSSGRDSRVGSIRDLEQIIQRDFRPGENLLDLHPRFFGDFLRYEGLRHSKGEREQNEQNESPCMCVRARSMIGSER